MKTRKSEKEVYSSIAKRKSFCFDAGPGAGKTYTLEKAIEYIIATDKKLKARNQKILCITYTNSAKDEIEKRIGKNSDVFVSTIHDFLWDFISSQDILLVQAHKDKIRYTLKNLQEKINKNVLYSEINDKSSFKKLICSSEFLEIYYKNYNEYADEFRSSLAQFNDLSSLLTNVGKFKTLVDLIVKKSKLIKATKNSFDKKHVLYDPTHNYDQLDKYIISHDTVLEYAEKIIVNNNLIKRLFIDKYPYVLIDEYQDTNLKVINLFKSILNYSSNVHKLILGFFGDSKQNIYKDGIGELTDFSDLKFIKEEENKRSSQNVVKVINRIRNDGLIQISEKQGGKCIFYKVVDENKFSIEELTKYFNTNGDTAYLLLKNAEMSKVKHFQQLYSCLQKFPHFKNQNYKNLSNEFFQHNLKNVGWFLRNILNLIDFKEKIENPNTSFKEVESFINDHGKLTFGELKNFLSELKKIDTSKISLLDYIKSLYKVSGIIKGNEIVSNIFTIVNELDEIYLQAVKYFYNGEKLDDSLNEFFNLDLAQFKNWYDYVYKKEDNTQNFYTLHGSKGLEFDNVVVVLEDQFAQKKDYFKFFFENYNKDDVLDKEERKRFNETRNLLYVACSRAKKNLYLVYNVPAVDEIEKNIEKIFGPIKTL